MSEVDYTNEINFKIEFQKNLNECVNEFKKLFSGTSQYTCVCAPGKFTSL